MARARFWLLTILIGAAGCATGPRETDALDVRFRISKPHGLVNFVQAIAGDSERSPILVELFRGSEHDNDATRKQIERFQNARQNLSKSISFEGFPLERRMGTSLEALFLVRSGSATSLQDLRERTAGLLPLADHQALFESLEALLPVYEDLVWEPNLAALERYLEQIRRNSTDWGLDELFRKASHFYRADWPEDTPFTVVLYPLPGTTGQTSAQSIGAFESVGVLLEETEMEGRFGVIFHEICHSLFGAQSREFQNELERMFVESGSPHARSAYDYLNEGLATAMGNGWAVHRAAGRLDDRSWYNDPIIEGFSKAIYPVVLEYLEQDRALDDEFVANAIALFAEQFPDFIYRYDGILNKILLLSDGRAIDPVEAGRQLRRRFRVSSVSRSSPIDHEITLGKVVETGETLLILVSHDHRDQLRGVAAAYPELQPAADVALASRVTLVHATVDPGGRAWIVVSTPDQAGLEMAFDAMKQAGCIDLDQPLLTVDVGKKNQRPLHQTSEYRLQPGTDEPIIRP